MKIAFVSDAAFPWHVGGVERTERMEAEALAKIHEVHFFSFKWKGMKPEFTDKGIHYHCSHYLTDNEFYRHGRRSIREGIYFSLIVWKLFNYRFDVIQVNAFPILHLPVVKLYCRLFNCKLIMDVHELWSKEKWTEYLGQAVGGNVSRYADQAISGADMYIANPGETYEGLLKLGIDKKRIRIFTPIIDDKEIKSIKAKQRKGLVVFGGRLIKEKRFDKWLKVMKSVSEVVQGAKGMIVGDGPDRDHVKSEIERMGLGGVVELREYYKEKKDIYRLVKSASIMLNMSEREGLSALALESLALGTPVVLPDYSPIPDVVKSMCVVGSERALPGMIAKILKSRDKSFFIKNRKDLERFKSSAITSFYKELFSMLR